MFRGIVLVVWVVYGFLCLAAWETSEVSAWQNPNKVVARVNE